MESSASWPSNHMTECVRGLSSGSRVYELPCNKIYGSVHAFCLQLNSSLLCLGHFCKCVLCVSLCVAQIAVVQMFEANLIICCTCYGTFILHVSG